MKRQNKTKKMRKKNKKRQTKKKYGGKSDDIVKQAKQAEVADTKRSDDIMDKVKDSHTINLSDLSLPEMPEPDLGDSNIIEKTGQLAEGVTVNAIENTGALLGVDLSDPKETSEKLDDIKESITNPENVEKMTEIVGEAAKVGAVAIKASEPFTDPLLDKSGEVLEKSGSIIGKAGVNIILNTAEAVKA